MGPSDKKDFTASCKNDGFVSSYTNQCVSLIKKKNLKGLDGGWELGVGSWGGAQKTDFKVVVKGGELLFLAPFPGGCQTSYKGGPLNVKLC